MKKRLLAIILLLLVPFTNRAGSVLAQEIQTQATSSSLPLTISPKVLQMQGDQKPASKSAVSIPLPNDSTPSATLSPTQSPAVPSLFADQLEAPVSSPSSHLARVPSLAPALNRSEISIQSGLIRRLIKIRQLQKRNYRADEAVTVHIENFHGARISPSITDPQGLTADLSIRQDTVDALTVFTIFPQQQFKPGKYTVSVTDSDGKISSQDFTWGVLAINTDKSVYLPAEQAAIAIAVLDDGGKMVCDAQLTLIISDPKGQKTTLTSANGQIVTNPQCLSHQVTEVADYETSYTTGIIGTYDMQLTAQTKNGTYSVLDSFQVAPIVPFDIARSAPTRIFPPNAYPVHIRVTAQQDFSGQIVERVPESFAVSQTPGVTAYDSVIVAPDDSHGATTEIALRLPFDGTFEKTQGFGEMPTQPRLKAFYEKNRLAGHDGVDFALPQGTPVVASDEGVVGLAGEGAYGITVVVNHSWGKTYYGHLSKVSVQEEQKVSKGQLLGFSGNTGLSIGPHLHFGMKRFQNDPNDGYFGKIDPLPYLGQSTRVADFSVKKIIWNVSFKKGEVIELGYLFRAPLTSPQFYLLGPLTFTPASTETPNFTEARNWQIAVDATVTIEQQVNFIDQEYATTNATFTPTDNSLGLILFDGTKYTGDTTYFEAVMKGTVGSDRTPNDVGQFTAMYCVSATDCKIVYYDATDSSLRFMDCDDATCSTGNIVVVDGAAGCTLTGCNTGFTTGQYPSIDCSAGAGDCKIAYYNNGNGDLYFADCDNATCDSGTITLLDGNTGCSLTNCDTNDNSGQETSIDCSPGATDCKISYYSVSGTVVTALMFADCDNATCSSGTTKILDGATGCTLTTGSACSTTDATGQFTSIDCSAGASDCKISYYNATGTALMFADCDAADCSSGSRQLLDGATGCTLTSGSACSTTDATGQYTSLDCTGGASDCKISYYNATGTALMFGDCDAADCGSGTRNILDGATGCVITSCSTAVSTGQYTSIDCAPGAGDCKISYVTTSSEEDNLGLHFIDCGSGTCGSGTRTHLDADTGCVLTGCTTALDSMVYTAIDCVGGASDCKIAYHNTTDNDVLFADCNDVDCDPGTTLVIDGNGAGNEVVGQYSAIDCPSATDCKIVYYDASDTSLRFMDCDDATCSTGTISILDGALGCTLTGCSTTDDTGQYPSIYCVSTTDCKISYYNVTAGDLMFADCDASTCNVGTRKLLDGNTGCTLTGGSACSTTNDTGQYSSIDCSPGATDCKISYYNITNTALMFADCGAADCSSGSRQILDGATGCTLTTGSACSTTDSTGQYTSIDCTPGATDCKISYYNSTGSALMFGDCDAADCSSGSRQILDGATGFTLTGGDSTFTTGQYTSIDCGPGAANCKISYYNSGGGDLYFADCDAADCSSGTARLLDGNTSCTLTGCATSGNTGLYTSLDCTGGDTDCKITYYHSSNGDLFFADCDATACTTGANSGTRSLLDGNTSCLLTGCASATNKGQYSSIDCTPGVADCKISYYNVTGTDLFFADCGSATCNSGNTAAVDDGREYVWARLFTDTGSAVADGVVMASSGTYTRVRQTLSMSLTDNGNYTLRVNSSDDTNTQVTVQAARLVVVQTDATALTATQTQIEVGNNETTTQTTYTQLTDKKIYRYDSGVFSPGPTVYFEATLSNNTAAQTASAALYTDGASCSTQVSGSEVIVTGTTWTRQKSSAITLTSGTDYMVCIKAGANTARIANAKIILDQSSSEAIISVETVQHSVNNINTDVDSTYTDQDYLNQFNPSNFANGTFSYYFEATLKTSAGTGYAQLWNDTDSSAVASSEVTTTSTSYARVRSASLTMPSSAKNMDTQLKNSASNTTSAASTWLIIQSSCLSAPTTSQQLHHGLWFSCAGVEQSFTF